MVAAGEADRTALTQSRTRSPAAGAGKDAADLLLAAVVQSVGPTGRGCDLRQRVDAAFRADRAGRRGSADESTILRFRHLLEQHGLTHAIFDAVADLLEERRLLLRSGTIVDATIIAAPSSTKNASAARDPEMKQTRKGRNWHFGMKLHIGADKRGIVHTVRATAASVADITQLPDLLHGQEREVFGDQAYWKEDDREFLETWGMRYRINRRPTSKRPLSERWRMINRARSRTRARGEHAFCIVKQLWGFAKVRYRGLAKKPNVRHSGFARLEFERSSRSYGFRIKRFPLIGVSSLSHST